jgi:hypothetical protein
LVDKGEELWEAFWQPAPDNMFPEKSISYRQVESEVQAPATTGTTVVVNFFQVHYNTYVSKEGVWHRL